MTESRQVWRISSYLSRDLKPYKVLNKCLMANAMQRPRLEYYHSYLCCHYSLQWQTQFYIELQLKIMHDLAYVFEMLHMHLAQHSTIHAFISIQYATKGLCLCLQAYIPQVPPYTRSIGFLQTDFACCVLLIVRALFLGLECWTRRGASWWKSHVCPLYQVMASVFSQQARSIALILIEGIYSWAPQSVKHVHAHCRGHFCLDCCCWEWCDPWHCQFQ